MPWRNYVAGLTDVTLGTLSGRNVGRVRKREREAAIAKPSRQTGWLAGRTGHWGPTHRLHDAATALLRCQKGWRSTYVPDPQATRWVWRPATRYPP